MKKLFFIGVIPLFLLVTSCTPLVFCGAAVGGAYVGYKAAEEGYSIKITKPVKGEKHVSKGNETGK